MIDARTAPFDLKLPQRFFFAVGLPLFLEKLFDCIDLQSHIGHDLFQAGILLFERFHPFDVGNLHPAVFVPPTKKSLFGDVVPAAHIPNRPFRRICLFEDTDNLLLGELDFLHGFLLLG